MALWRKEAEPRGQHAPKGLMDKAAPSKRACSCRLEEQSAKPLDGPYFLLRRGDGTERRDFIPSLVCKNEGSFPELDRDMGHPLCRGLSSLSSQGLGGLSGSAVVGMAQVKNGTEEAIGRRSPHHALEIVLGSGRVLGRAGDLNEFLF